MGKQKNVHQEWILVRKHLTRGFPCAVLDLSGTLWPLLIPEYSGIKRRGTPFPGLRNPGISHYGEKYPLPFYELYGKRWLFATLSLIGRDHLIICKSGILILIFADNNYSIYAHAMLILHHPSPTLERHSACYLSPVCYRHPLSIPVPSSTLKSPPSTRYPSANTFLHLSCSSEKLVEKVVE